MLILTTKGHAFCKQTLLLKQQLEDEIKQSIDIEKFDTLKEIMGQKWMQ